MAARCASAAALFVANPDLNSCRRVPSGFHPAKKEYPQLTPDLSFRLKMQPVTFASFCERAPTAIDSSHGTTLRCLRPLLQILRVKVRTLDLIRRVLARKLRALEQEGDDKQDVAKPLE